MIVAPRISHRFGRDDLAQARFRAARARCHRTPLTLGLRLRASVETSLDTAGTSARATSGGPLRRGLRPINYTHSKPEGH
jgi:hypothetical protein